MIQYLQLKGYLDNGAITRYVNSEQLNELFEKSEDGGVKIGPWFRLIRDNFLDKIWINIDSFDNIRDKKVHHMGEVI